MCGVTALRKAQGTIIFNNESLKALPLRQGIKLGCLLPPFLLEVLVRAIREKKRKERKKRNPFWKGKCEIICSLMT